MRSKTYPDTLAFIAIHGGDSYEVPWGIMRDGIYQAGWIPFSCHDGLEDAWPIETYESKFISRQAVLTDVTIDGVEITLAAGECATVIETIVLNSVSQASPENVKFFAWAQDTNFVYDPYVQYFSGTWYGAWFAEIYQGGKALAPFDEGIFADGLESGETTSWSTIVP